MSGHENFRTGKPTRPIGEHTRPLLRRTIFLPPCSWKKVLRFCYPEDVRNCFISLPSISSSLRLCDQLTPWELSFPPSVSLVLPAGVSIAAPVAAPLWRKEEKSSLAGSGEDFANGMPGEGRLFPCRTKWNSANARPTQPCHGERRKTFSYATEEENCGIAFRPSFLSSTFFLAHLRTRKSTGRKEVDEKGSKYMV